MRKTAGWTADHKQKYINIGSYATREEALQALAMYNASPYDMGPNLTFKEVYERWSAEHYPTLAESGSKAYKSAYKHSASLHNMQMRDIRVSHLETAMAAPELSNNTRRIMKFLYNKMYAYAMRHEIVQKDYAKLCKLAAKQTKSTLHKIFTADEIAALWDNLDMPYVKIILINMYSGWRPQELATLDVADIDLEANTMTGGMKTEAGIRRVVPIHPRIRPFVEEYVEKAARIGSVHLFNGTFAPMNYRNYSRYFAIAMKNLNMTHLPHDCRHTFVTLAKEADMNEYVLKRIVGHVTRDVTEYVYTHRALEELQREIEKIK